VVSISHSFKVKAALSDNVGGDQPQGSFLATGGEQEDPDAPQTTTITMWTPVSPIRY
jgi:hypothetical protein